MKNSMGNDSQKPDGIYVKTSTSPAVKVVSKDVFDKFNIKTDDLVEPPPPADKPKP